METGRKHWFAPVQRGFLSISQSRKSKVCLGHTRVFLVLRIKVHFSLRISRVHRFGFPGWGFKGRGVQR